MNDIKSFDFAWSYTKVPLLANAPHFRNASAASGCEEVRSISNPPADVYLGGGFEIDVLAAAIMKRFEQISDKDLNKLTVFNCFIIIIFLFCLMKMEY